VPKSRTGMRYAASISALIFLMPLAVFAANQDAGRTEATRASVEPPEFGGPFKPAPIAPDPGLKMFAESKLIAAASPKKPETLAPAISDLTKAISISPNNSDLYFLRASLQCFAKGPVREILTDIAKSLSLRSSRTDSAYENAQGHYALMAKVKYQSGDYEAALADLNKAIGENLKSADQAFNDGEVKSTEPSRPCYWSVADFKNLERLYPKDARPPLFLGIYYSLYSFYNTNFDYSTILGPYKRAGELDPNSALPPFFTGHLYVLGHLSGLLSMASAKCLDDVVPRTAECIALDELRENGTRALTTALAIDPTLSVAYSERALNFVHLHKYERAVGDYTKAIELAHNQKEQQMLVADKALAEFHSGRLGNALADYNKALANGCAEAPCELYNSRGDIYLKLGDYRHALVDCNLYLRSYLESGPLFLINIDQFRSLYPEFDTVDDLQLTERLRKQFFPQISALDFRKRFLQSDKGMLSFILADAYARRGDILKKLGKTAEANREYDRITRAFADLNDSYFTFRDGRRIRNIG
jgi:tetratricopeptide (TPR) repeat protein